MPTNHSISAATLRPSSRITHIRAAATSVNPCTGARSATSHGTSVAADLPGCRSAPGAQNTGFAGYSRQAGPVRPVYNTDQPITALKGTGIRTLGPSSQGLRHLFADEKGRRSIGMAVNGGVYFVGDPRFGSRLRRRRVHFRRELRFHASRGFRGTPWPKGILRMRPPRRGLEQLDLLGHQQWPELRGEPLDEILICVHGCPMGSPA